MTEFPIAVTPAGVGRPPLSKKAVETRLTTVRLTEKVRERIAALVGENRMAAFIREAIDNELKRRERTQPNQAPTKVDKD